MPYYRQVGEIPRKRHTRFRQPDGTLYAEELMGAEGFSSDSALLYHRYLPTAIVNSQRHDAAPSTRTPNLPLLPRHLRPHELAATGGDAVTGRAVLLANDDCRIGYAVADRPSPLYRNAVGDECVYVESGTARFESVLGGFDIGAGDYLVVPTSTTYRIVPTGDQPRAIERA